MHVYMCVVYVYIYTYIRSCSLKESAVSGTSNPHRHSWSRRSPYHIAQKQTWLLNPSPNFGLSKQIPRTNRCAEGALPRSALPGSGDHGPAPAPMLQETEQLPVRLPARASWGRDCSAGEVDHGTGTRGDAWESFQFADEDEEKPLRQTPQSKCRW